MVAMFPMNLVLAASYNQDSVALGLTYIIIGLFLNYVTDDEKVVKIKDLLLYAFLCVILVTMSSLCLACRIIAIYTEKENAMQKLLSHFSRFDCCSLCLYDFLVCSYPASSN